jgi:hypothetical protein
MGQIPAPFFISGACDGMAYCSVGLDYANANADREHCHLLFGDLMDNPV